MLTIRNTINILILSMTVSLSAFCQEQPLYSQFTFNKFLFNPAVAGSEQVTVIKALEMIARSNELEPSNTYYIYVYGIALNSGGDSQHAIEILEKGYQINPLDYNILQALSSICRDIGNENQFQYYYAKMLKLQGQSN